MKRTRFALCLTLMLVLLLSLSPLAFAETAVVGQDAMASGAEDGSVFLAGTSARSTAQIKGILFSAGNSVSASGECEYAMLAGADVTLAGRCLNDAFLAGRSVTIAGETARDIYAAGQTVTVASPVGRDFYAMADTVVIGADVGGDVYISAGTIKISDDVSIGGKLSYNSDAKIEAPQALIAGAEVYENEKAAAAEAKVEAPKSATTMSRVKDKVFGYIGLLLVGFAFLWLTPLWETVDARWTGLPFGKYAAAFGIGFAILIGLPIVAILLMITGFGLRLAFVLLLAYIIILIMGPLVLSFFLGGLIWRQFVKKDANYWIELPIGLLVWRLLTLIPVVKTVVGFVAAPLALGVLTLLLRWKKAAPKATPPEEAPAPLPVEAEPAEELVPAVEDPYPEPNPEPVAEEPVPVEEPVSAVEEPVFPVEDVPAADEPISSEG